MISFFSFVLALTYVIYVLKARPAHGVVALGLAALIFITGQAFQIIKGKRNGQKTV
jgi:hypothetical protein